MPATPDRIAFVLEPFRRAVVEDETVRDRHGSNARESADPMETFFDDAVAAQAMAEERMALLGTERRLFPLSVRGLDEALDLDLGTATMPGADFVDAEKAAAMRVVIAQVSFDFGRQQAAFTLWG